MYFLICALVFGHIAKATAQICITEFKDSNDQLQISDLKLGMDASQLFRFPARSTDCSKEMLLNDEYGCNYRMKDGMEFRIYYGKIMNARVPAKLLTKDRNIAGLRPFEDLKSAIRKVSMNMPEGFPVLRAYYDSKPKGFTLSTGQCLVSSTAERWELNLEFDGSGRLFAVDASIPYP